jgi:flagellar protein FlaG
MSSTLAGSLATTSAGSMQPGAQQVDAVAGVGSNPDSTSVSEASKTAPLLDPEQQAQAVQEAVEQLGEFLGAISSDLKISVDNDVNRTVVKVINRSNDEVIRQIPSDEVLALMRRMSEIFQQLAPSADVSGVLLNDRV